MSERKIETTFGIEAYISKSGAIALKQEDPDRDDQIVLIEPRDVHTVIKWLNELLEESKEYTSE